MTTRAAAEILGLSPEALNGPGNFRGFDGADD